MLTDKEKHQKRFQQKQNHIRHQVKLRSLYYPHKTPDEPHRYHKRSSLNCGTPNCPFCSNPRRVWNELTFQERKHLWNRFPNNLKDSSLTHITLD